MTSLKITPLENQEHVARSAIGAALINPDPTLPADVLMRSLNNAVHFIPTFQNATQAAGGKEIYAPSLSPDGQLTVYLEAVPPAPVSGQLGGATAVMPEISVTLCFNQSGRQQQVVLSAQDQGNNIWQLSARLAGAELQALRSVLFDSVPSANLMVTRKVRMAAQLTEGFVETNWKNEDVREALKQTFSGAIPFHTASQFYQIVQQAYPSFPQEFMVMDGSYGSQIAMPPLPGFIQWQITWEGQAHNYYQDNQQLNRIFFLPDNFALAIEPLGGPTLSLLKFHMPDANVENAQATFRFFGSATANFNRIADAKSQLTGKIGQKPDMVSLQYASDVTKTFTLTLPNAAGTASNPRPQPNAQIDLYKGLRNEVQLGFTAFQALWAAIFSDRPEQTIFTGWVDVGLSNGKFMNRISFVGRLPTGKQADYYNEIIDQGSDVNYSNTLGVNVPAGLFATTADPQVLALNLIFGPNTTASIEAPSGGDHGPMLKTSVTVNRSISDILLGKASGGTYDYTLKVVTLESEKCCQKVASSDQIYITLDDIKDCDGSCR